MNLQFQCPHCSDTLEVEFSVQKSEKMRDYPVLHVVRLVTVPIQRMTELAATVMGNEMKRRSRHFHAGAQARIVMGKVKA